MTPQMRAVETYLQHEISVLPLRPDSKQPVGRWKNLQNYRMSVQNAASWWNGKASPLPGIGVITGAISHNLAVLDVEPEHVLYVRNNVRLPDAGVVTTARGGLHVYCRGEMRSTKLTVAGVTVGDVRGTGGYVVAPPTPIGDGTYSWAIPADFDHLPDVPAWAEPLAVRQCLPPRSSRFLLPQDLQQIVPSKVQLALAQPRQLQPSSWSEWIYWTVFELSWIDLPFETIESLLTESLPDYFEDRTVRKGDQGYLMRVYQNALSEIDRLLDRAVEVCVVNVAEFGSLVPRRSSPIAQARVDASLRVVSSGQIVRYRTPRILADGSVAPEYRHFLAAFGVFGVEDTYAPQGSALAIIEDNAVRRFVVR